MSTQDKLRDDLAEQFFLRVFTQNYSNFISKESFIDAFCNGWETQKSLTYEFCRRRALECRPGKETGYPEGQSDALWEVVRFLDGEIIECESRGQEVEALCKVERIALCYEEDVMYIVRGETPLFALARNATVTVEYAFLSMVRAMIRRNVSQDELRQICDILTKEFGS